MIPKILSAIWQTSFSVLGGIWGYVAAAAFSALVAGWLAHSLQAKIDQGPLNSLKAQLAQQQANAANASLKQFEADAATMHEWAASYQSDSAALGDKLSAIKTEFAHAIKSAPLPADCKPDAGRLHSLAAAIAATNSTITAAAGQRAGGTVPGSP